jgi:hypothetical protein
MDLSRRIYGPIPNRGFLSSKPIGVGAVQEKSYRNDRIFERPENAMRCSEMVEVVE